MKPIFLNLMFALMFFQLVGCTDSDSYSKKIEDIATDIVSVEIFLEKPFGEYQKITDEQELKEIKGWLNESSLLESIGSYPAALVNVVITQKGGKTTSLNLSQPVDNLDYTVINFDGELAIGRRYPRFVIYNKVSL